MDYKSTLLAPLKIGNKECPNRFFIQAMEGNDADDEGNPSELTCRRYEELFKGDAGMVSLESIFLSPDCRRRQCQLVLARENLAPIAALVRRLRAINPATLFIFQLNHAGENIHPALGPRIAVKANPAVAASLLSEEEIAWIMDAYVASARLAYEAGADGVDVKLCHGYLSMQMLRPFNDRSWKYGGSWENRRTFAFELYERIRKAVPDEGFLLGSKISLWDASIGGFGTAGPDTGVMDLSEPIDLAKGLVERGASFLIQSASGPDLIQPSKKAALSVFLHQSLAKALKEAVGPDTAIIGSGYSLLAEGKHPFANASPDTVSLFRCAARNIERGWVDSIGLGRQSFADPHLPRKLREGAEAYIRYCIVCDACSKLQWNDRQVGCAVHDPYYARILKELNSEAARG